MKRFFIAAVLGVLGSVAFSAEEVKQFKPTGTIPILPIEETIKTFHLPEGYRLEPVLSEPYIAEPVLSVFDGNGRMYVAEMRTYMQDADATGEFEPTSRVSLHEDTDGDGKMDKHSVFADNLLLPRMVLPLDDRVLIGETNTLDIYSYRDTDGDGVADEKKLWYEGGERGGNMEHQPSGLIWSMDNWIYTTYNAYRLRHNPNGLALRESTAPNGGQWGLCQDDEGKPWYVNAGGERGPLNFQQPIVYGAFNVADQFPVSYREVFPLVGLPDMQGGERRMRPEDNTLNHFTATCGAEIFRGDRLPEDIRGDLLFSEPVGRLIRRSNIEVRDGVTYLKNADPGTEFIRSTDPNFRAVNTATGPDGCLYIVDMYRGIIQEGNWAQPGSYLRGVIDEYGSAKNIRCGRVYRLVHDDFEPGPKPNMLDESSADLVAHLEHPNGWWRDTAQKLLVVRGDTSVAGALKKLASESADSKARMHAIWTLEGLGCLTPNFAREMMNDDDPLVRRTAIRASETLYKAGEEDLRVDVIAMSKDPDPNVAIQALMTAKLLKFPDYDKLISKTSEESKSRGVKEIGEQLLSGGNASLPKLTTEEVELYKEGQIVYQSLCFACHGPDGKGMPVAGDMRLAPSLVDAKIFHDHHDLATKVVMYGISGPVEGKTYPGEMIAMESNGDEWVASVLSYVRNSFGNQFGFVTEADVARIRKDNEARKTPWTEAELYASVPQRLTDHESWKVTASHKPEDAGMAIDGNKNTRYTTGTPMKPGMWFQVELPEPAELVGLTVDAGKSRNDYPRGCTVELSADGKTWSKAAEVPEEKLTKLSIDFPKQTARYLRITQVGEIQSFWSIHDLQLFEAPKS